MKTLEIFAAATPSKRIINGYVMVDNILTLCDVKFHSIDTHSGDITYLVTVKGDKEVSKLMTNIHVFASVDNYKKGLEYGETFELVRFVKNVINLLDIPATICVDKDNAELFLLSYKYENGEVKCVKKFSPIIYDDKEKNSFEFEGLYKSREEVFAWNDILFKPNYREGFTDSWYLQINEDIVLITFSRTELLGKYKKLTISTNNIENEDLELILNYFLFLNKGYSNLLEDKTNSELLSIVDNYFNNDVWFDLAFDTDSETKLPYNEVLREFLEEKILSEVSLHDLISDGYIELDY